LYSLFSDLTLSEAQILRIQSWVDLHMSTLTILGTIISVGGWNSNTSTIVVAPSGTINITTWTDVNSKIKISGYLLVNTLFLYGSTLDVDAYATISDNFVANNAVLEIKGNVYINSSSFHNTKFIFTPHSNLTFWSCVDLSESDLTVRISPNDLIGNQTDIIILTSNNSCLQPFRSTSGIATHRPCIAVDVTQHYNATTIWITFTMDESPCIDNNKWVILFVSIIAVVIFLSVILVISVHKIPLLRKKLLPFRDFQRYVPQMNEGGEYTEQTN